MPAQKIRKITNTKNILEHKEGAVVEFIQTLIHKPFGTLSYVYWGTFPVYLSIVASEDRKSEKYFKRLIRKHPVDKSNSRLFSWDYSDGDLLRFAEAGYTLVIFSYLTIEVFTIEVLQLMFNLGKTSKSDWSEIPIKGRLKEIIKILDCKDIDNVLLEKFGLIEQVRHNVMHPKPDNLINTEEWDKVPLAWLLSERRKYCFSTASDIIKHFESPIKEFREKYDHPVTLQGVRRGVEFTYPAKKS